MNSILAGLIFLITLFSTLTQGRRGKLYLLQTHGNNKHGKPVEKGCDGSNGVDDKKGEEYREKLQEKSEEEKSDNEKKEYVFRCQQGLNTNCDENGKCQILCGDGKKFKMTCPNKGSIESIENVNGLSRIRCGKKVEFAPCFPFCNRDKPKSPMFEACFPFCNKN